MFCQQIHADDVAIFSGAYARHADAYATLIRCLLLILRQDISLRYAAIICLSATPPISLMLIYATDAPFMMVCCRRYLNITRVFC